jgi:3-keto-disaccharide hydrolase
MITRRTLLGMAPAALLPAMPGDAGFTPLFDGRSLAGWNVIEGPESAFYIEDGAITVHPGANFPTWLRSARRYENFDFRGEYYLKGWMDSGIYLHAAEHGRPGWTGFEVKLFHEQEAVPTPYSCGSIFPLVAPRLVKVNNKGQWNSFRILFDWPALKVWMNDALVQDLDVDSVPELRYRLRKGYLGFESLSYPIRFRNLAIQELPGKEKWTSLYDSPSSLDQWFVSDGKPVMEPLGGILRLEGLGHIATKVKYRDFEYQSYIRTSRSHNGGVIFRSSGGGTHAQLHYEIQLHNVEGAHFPTGSLYHFKRSIYPRIADEKWWLMQLVVKGPRVVVRINGENVLEYDQLENVDEGHLELQAHAYGTWAEYKEMKIKII